MHTCVLASTTSIEQMATKCFPKTFCNLQSGAERDEDLPHSAPGTFRAMQADLIISLRERVQNPPPGAFSMNDLVWTNHITQGQGKQKTSKLAVILWDRLEDFIKGEEEHPQFPCNFTKEIVRVNLPNSLRTPRAHSPALVIRYDLMPAVY